MNTRTDYWFTIEPYVYVGIANKHALLYNTIDRETLELNQDKVIKLLEELLRKENCGVVLLTQERFKQKEINEFIEELRKKYMGDIIDVNLSKGKPVQLLPYFNFSYKDELYKEQNISPYKNIIEKLSEISIHVNQTTKVVNLISFLQSVPESLTFNIIGNIKDVVNYRDLLSFLEHYPAPKNMVSSYADIIPLQPSFENNFSYRMSVHFPIDLQKWNDSRQIFLNQTLTGDYIFNVSSLDDYQQAEQLVEQYQLDNYHLIPVYTGENLDFFKENVFHTKEDILSTSMSIKDFFSNQAINIYDFGKINIMPNGDAYANVHHPLLGNIYTHSIYEIVQKEVEEGISWFRIRNQAPCNTCIYQWLCPPPSNYEIVIGRPNLCHIK